ncbi:MAG: glycosyltransferase [Bacteroidales bacterium]|nr:glycosyltransferase [Bacteroidales bacterium]
MRTLIFITSRFPFEPGEAFIDSEFPFLCSAFEKKIIITRNVTLIKQKNIPKDVRLYRHNPSSSLKEYMQIPLLLLRNFRKTAQLIKEELHFRKGKGKKNGVFKNLLLLKAIIKSLQLRDFISDVIKTEIPQGEILLYSYWMNTGARAICMLDNIKAVRITRAHRVDLYEEEADNGYLPLVRHTFLKLDAIFFISEHGKAYFENSHGLIHDKNIVSRLGIINPLPFRAEINDSKVFRIVSCSSLIKVKRVHLLIGALALVKTSERIIWHHFGEGPLEDELKTLAAKVLGNSGVIEYKFMGRVMNDQIMKFYSENKPDLFVNTSSSEGIPVSIMEAQSFGIPVIATDTGGTSEIIGKQTGILIPVDFSTEELARNIENILYLEPVEKTRMKKAIYENWKMNFNAFTNFKNFINNIDTIMLSTRQ